MLNIYVDKNEGRIKIETDDPRVITVLEVETKKTEYIAWKRQYGTVIETTRLYEGRKPKPKNGIYHYTINLGWAAYICNVFKNSISQDTYNQIAKDAILSENYRTIPFDELRDYQNEDVLHILKYKRALFSCYTGYGKTSVIAALANYAYSMGESVLIVTPGKKANDEIVKRIKNNYGIDTNKPGVIFNMITSGLLKRNDVKDPTKFEALKKEWNSYKWILVDEVEYTINPSGELLFSSLTNVEHLYGFSGTADKDKGEMISFRNGLSEIIIRNKDLVKYFGPSLVYRLPLMKDIDSIIIKTYALDKLKLDENIFKDAHDIYHKVMNAVWTDPDVVNVIIKLIKRFPRLFLPINNLTTILSDWINNYFIGKFKILLICGDGYFYYDLQGNKTELTLQESWDKVNNGEVDVIPSTVAGYRALDLPGLDSILMLDSLKAGQVLQYIGRCCRGSHLNVLTLEPKSRRKIPIFSRSTNERKERFKEYYKYCNIQETEIYEEDL